MVKATSLGAAESPGLPYLLKEGLISKNVAVGDCHWAAYNIREDAPDCLLTTASSVIHSRAGLVKSILSFDGHDGPIVRSFITLFDRSSQDVSETQVSPIPSTSQQLEVGIVVAFKSSLHIFLESGQKHVLYLSLELSTIHAIPVGFLIERAETPASTSLADFPAISAPHNTFNTQWSPLSPTPLRDNRMFNVDSLLNETFRNFALTHPEAIKDETSAIRFAALFDPLSSVSDVVFTAATSDSRYAKNDRHQPMDDSILGWVGNGQSISRTDSSENKFLISRNGTTGAFTVWQQSITIVEGIDSGQPASQPWSQDLLSVKGSFAPAYSQQSIDDTIINKAFSQKQSQRRESRNRHALPPAHHVDEFDQLENELNEKPQKRFTKRMSSLLARSDLETIGANTTSGVSSKISNRASKSQRISQSRHSLLADPTLEEDHAPHSSFAPNMLSQQYTNASLDDYDMDKPGFVTSAISDQKKKVLKFFSIGSFHMPTSSQFSDLSSISLISHSNGQSPSSSDFMFSLFDKSSRQLFTYNLRRSGQQDSQYAGEHAWMCTLVSDFRNVLDVSSLRLFDTNSLVFLQLTETNGMLMQTITQSFNSTVQLPPGVLIYNPYTLSTTLSSEMSKFVGKHRQRPQPVDRLIGLQRSVMQGNINLVDVKSRLHILELVTEPQSAFIKKVLACGILEKHSIPRYTLQSIWAEAYALLRGETDVDLDLEWSALFISIMLSFLPFLVEPPKSPITRVPRKKTGLLRTSSGANAELQEFNDMARNESYGQALPSWLQGSSWGWLNIDEVYEAPELNLRATKPLPQGKLDLPKSASIIQLVKLGRKLISQDQEANGVLHSTVAGLLSMESQHVSALLADIVQIILLTLEECKLDLRLSEHQARLPPLIAQLGQWMGWPEYGVGSGSKLQEDYPDIQTIEFDNSTIKPTYRRDPPSATFDSYLALVAKQNEQQKPEQSQQSFTSNHSVGLNGPLLDNATASLFPRVSKVFGAGSQQIKTPLRSSSVSSIFELESWPESIFTMVNQNAKADISNPSTESQATAKQLIEDTRLHLPKDIRQLAHSAKAADSVGTYNSAAEGQRRLLSRHLFSQDQRFTIVSSLLHPLNYPVAYVAPEPDWTDTQLLEAQQEIAKLIAFRTISVSPGRAMLFYNARHPILTEKLDIHGFTLHCVMKPGDITVSADKSLLQPEERVAWAFFHAGAEVGLSISKEASIIDTSWIVFNRPDELNNRHAGLLLALGLQGHLRKLPKYVAFKYLGPKHCMTSIGMLLGLSASWLGTKNSTITRLLAVHLECLLPHGASELNHSKMTQTAGLLGLGLLYCDSQHRRMTEVLLAELENITVNEEDNTPNDLRNESYRLAAGFGIGYINLGGGDTLKGLHNTNIVEKLLSLAVGTKKVSAAHVLDRATSGAIVALILMFMKTGNQTIAAKIDIPESLLQYDYIRPDNFLLRTLAKNLIMWDEVGSSFTWVKQNAPYWAQSKLALDHIHSLRTSDLALLNIIAGLCMSLGLRWAGSHNEDVCNILIYFLDRLMRICKLPARNYDQKLTRTGARNCQDTIALSAACVMAGSGNLNLLRRFRALHGRYDDSKTFGSYVAAHQALGILFLGGGTHTFSSSNLAIASLLCAFYPLHEADVSDATCYLPAFRHMWSLAATPRCLVVRQKHNVDLLNASVTLTFKDGAQINGTAPYLIPNREDIVKITVSHPDFKSTILLPRRENSKDETATFDLDIVLSTASPSERNGMDFESTLDQLSRESDAVDSVVWESIWKLPSLAAVERSRGSVGRSGQDTSITGIGEVTKADDLLSLRYECLSGSRTERLRNVKMLIERSGDETDERFTRDDIQALEALVVSLGGEV